MLFVDFLLENPDIGEIPVVIGVIQPVTDDKVVRALEADVIRGQGGVVADLFIQEGDGFDAAGAAGGEELLQVLERQARVDDIVHQDDVPPVMSMSTSLLSFTTPEDLLDRP